MPVAVNCSVVPVLMAGFAGVTAIETSVGICVDEPLDLLHPAMFAAPHARMANTAIRCVALSLCLILSLSMSSLDVRSKWME